MSMHMKKYSFNVKSLLSASLPFLECGSIVFNKIRIPCSEIELVAHNSVTSSGWINTTRQYFYIESKSIRLEIKHVHRRFCFSSKRQDAVSAKYDELFCRFQELAVPPLAIRIARSLLAGEQMEIHPFILTKEGIVYKSWTGKKFCSWDWAPRGQLALKPGDITNPFILHQLIQIITHLSPETFTRVRFGEIKCSSKNFSPFMTLLWLVSPQPNEDKILGLMTVINFFKSNEDLIESAPESAFKKALLRRFWKPNCSGSSDYEVILFD